MLTRHLRLSKSSEANASEFRERSKINDNWVTTSGISKFKYTLATE